LINTLYIYLLLGILVNIKPCVNQTEHEIFASVSIKWFATKDQDIMGEAFKLDKQLPEQEKSNSWPLNLLKERYPKIFRDKDCNPIDLNLSEIEEKLDNLSTPRKLYLYEPK